MRRVFVGIDGGGTRARALVVDEHGSELMRATGPAGILRAEDPAASAAVMEALTRDVLHSAGALAADAVLCCALAGAGRDTEREALRVALTVADVAAHVLVVGDAEAMMADAFGAGPGVLLIAGTGSIAWARTEPGRHTRVGGWGLLLGDEGSGYSIGLAALRAIARAHDRRAPATALTARVIAQLQLVGPPDLIGWSARASKADIGALAPLVLRSADDGDDVAIEVRTTAVAELALLVMTAVRECTMHRPHVAFAGGLIEPAAPLRAHVEVALRERVPDCTIDDRIIDGARGATLLARSAVAREP